MSQSKPLKPWTNRPNPFQGTPGPQGPPGEDGAEWHNVTGTPAGSLGSLGDWALNPASGQVWQKTGTSSWTARGSLQGPHGDAGTITGATATGLAAGASPTVTLGGTPSARTFAFGIPKGDQGDAGAAATVSVGSTTTGAPGSNASVTQGGTPQERVFDFTIPRGATGAKGDKGDPGGAGILGGAKIYQPSHQTNSIPNSSWRWVHLHSDAAPGLSGVALPWSTSTGYTPRVSSTGWWMVGASLSWASGATNRRIMAVETWTGTDPGVSNGTRIIVDENNPVANPNRPTHNANTVINLEANTNIRLIAWQNSGGSLSTDPDWGPTELWLTRIL